MLHEAGMLLRVAGPIVLSQLGTVGMTTMDTIMVGPLGAESLAAVGLANALHMATLMVATGTIIGMTPLVSQAFGAGDRLHCRRVLMQGMWLSLMLSVPIIAFNVAGGAIARLFGQEQVVSELVGGYMGALAWGVAPWMVFMALRQFLEGMALTKPAMVITFVGLGVNFVGNRALIYGVDGWIEPLGVVGSGWSTTVVRWAMLLVMAGWMMWREDLHPFRGVSKRLDGVLLRRVASVGGPIGAQIGLEVGLFSFAAVMMGWFGALELGSHQVTINIAATTFMVALGVALAGSIRVGQHIGARRVRGVRRAAMLTYALATGFMAVCAVLFLTIPEPLLRLYTGDPDVISLGVELLFMAALFQIFDGAQAAGFGVLRGAADTRVPMLHAGLSYWIVGLPATYLLAFHTPLGPAGIWAGLCVALATATLLLTLRVRKIIGRLEARTA